MMKRTYVKEMPETIRALLYEEKHDEKSDDELEMLWNPPENERTIFYARVKMCEGVEIITSDVESKKVVIPKNMMVFMKPGKWKMSIIQEKEDRILAKPIEFIE